MGKGIGAKECGQGNSWQGNGGKGMGERTGVPTNFFLFPCPTFPCHSYATLAAGILPVGAAFRTMSKNTNLFCSEGGPMKSYRETLTFNVPKRMDFINITPQVEAAVAKSGVREGLVLINAMHITASVFINDDEPGLHEDYKRWLEQLAPFDPSPERYHHNRTGEDNGDAHHKRQIMGREVVVAITDGKLDFGPWEQIFYGEFDGRRPKRVLVKIIGE